MITLTKNQCFLNRIKYVIVFDCLIALFSYTMVLFFCFVLFFNECVYTLMLIWLVNRTPFPLRFLISLAFILQLCNSSTSHLVYFYSCYKWELFWLPKNHTNILHVPFRYVGIRWILKLFVLALIWASHFVKLYNQPLQSLSCSAQPCFFFFLCSNCIWYSSQTRMVCKAVHCWPYI